MNKVKLEDIIKSKNIVIPTYIFKMYKKFNLTCEELILLMYLYDKDNTNFEPEQTSVDLDMDIIELMGYMSNLTDKGFISLDVDKHDNKLEEIINLKPFYEKICFEVINTNEEKKKDDNIYSIIEKEFNRRLSPYEISVIKDWQDNDYNDDIILEAVKESSLNGVSNLKYIDKILFNWSKMGINCVDDLKKSNEVIESSDEVYSYNWLDDDNDEI